MIRLWKRLNCANRIYCIVLLLWLLSLLFRIAALAQQTNTYPRIDITLHCTNAATANALWQVVTNRVLPSDKFTNDGRNVEIILKTNAAGSFALQATYLFLTTNRAEFIWNYLTNRAVPSQTSGKFSYHFCPEEGKIRNWTGCDTAGYRQLIWP